jgi:ELWxxDGT repeat protein
MRRAIAVALGLATALLLVRGIAGASEAAGPVHLVHDFFPGEFVGDPPPEQLTRLGKELFFVATDLDSDHSVWRTDGTAAGTARVPLPGEAGTFGSVTTLGSLGGRLLWMAGSQASPDAALFAAAERGDGVRLLTFPSGAAMPQIVGERLYLLSCAGSQCAFWSTDGTAAGTAPVAALAGRSPDPGTLETLAGRWLIFREGPALLAYDVTRNEVLRLLDGPGVGALYPVGETLFIINGKGDNQRLWASRLDAPRATLLFSSPGIGIAGWRDGRLYFADDDGQDNGRLWSTDGRLAGTYPYSGVRVETFSLLADQLGPVGPGGSRTLIPMPGYYYGALLAADENKRRLEVVLPVCRGKYPCLGRRQSTVTLAGGVGFEDADDRLARSDGTPEGTFYGSGLREIKPETFAAVDGRLVLGATRGGVRQLWETDGTAAGTRALSDGTRDQPFDPQGPPISYNGALFVAAERKPAGQQLWRVAGGRTAPVTALRHLASGSVPFEAFPAGGSVLIEGGELDGWLGVGPDGTVESLPDFENACDQIFPPAPCPNPVTPLAARAVYAHGAELWSTDGTAAGTLPVTGGDGTPFEAAALGRWGDRALVLSDGGGISSTDGTSGGTRLLAEVPTDLDHLDQYQWIVPPAPFGASAVLFRRAPGGEDGSKVLEVWRTDGTQAGTLLLASTPFPDDYSYYVTPVEAGGRFFFRFGGTLWMSDGTPAGTRPLPQQPPGGTFALAASGGILYAGAGYLGGDEAPETLWAIDPATLAATLLGTFPSVSQGFVNGELGQTLDGALLFGVFGPRGNESVWVTTGTAASTHRLGDLLAGLTEEDFFTVGGRRYFAACEAEHGCELWSADRLGGDLQRVTDLWPGPRGSDPEILWAGDGSALFAATEPTVGRELWRLDPAALARAAAPAPAKLLAPLRRQPARKGRAARRPGPLPGRERP